MEWLHIKCSNLSKASDRRQIIDWKGPCCRSSTPPASPTPPPPQPPRNNPLPQPPNPPNSPPPPTTTSTTANTVEYADFNILQININGILGKLDELLHHMAKHNIHIAAIQETKLTIKSHMRATPNYTLVRKDREKDKGGGLAFLVHNLVPFQKVSSPANLKNDQHIEELTISINGNNTQLMIRNIYIPPSSSCSSNYRAPSYNILEGLNDTSIILGDMNAHHSFWHSQAAEDIRGRDIAETINASEYGILNEDTPTRITSNCKSSPDLSLATAALLPTCAWSTLTTLGSDHLPIIITLSTEDIKKIKAPNRTFINFKKADWAGFKEYTESIFCNSVSTNDVHVDEKHFRTTLNKATKIFIPQGRIPKIINAMPTEAVKMMDERDRLRTEDPSDERILILNKEIQSKVNNHRKDKWIEHLNSCEQGSQKLWKTIKSINKPDLQPDNQGINFNGKTENDPKRIANHLNRQYTPGATTKPSKEFRSTLRKMRKKNDDEKINITMTQTSEAIKQAKSSKALGPDDISPIMLKHLGPYGIKFLTELYNNSTNQAIIPYLWKVGRIIPLLKPGKPADEGPSYRPVSLLSPAAKILEKILQEPISNGIELEPHQHGFRKGRSTVTALQEISDYITEGLNKNKPVNRTVAVAIDLSKAFDTVDHEILLTEISLLPINSHIKRFLFAYLRGRMTYVEFRGSKSKYRKMRQGVPQGGVLSPLLFNMYMSSMPSPPDSIKLVTYADDGTALSSGPAIDPICTRLNRYLDTLTEWFSRKNLQISPSKSSATLFTTFSNEMKIQLPIFINGSLVPTIQKPKLLGVTLDSMFTFKHHAINTVNKLQNRNNILKALAGTSWGMSKEVLLTTYKAIGQSILNYGCPIWTPALSKTHWENLQTCQNAGLRTALGCVKMTSTDHLHAEAKIMPVKDHCCMITEQFLLATQKPEHPNQINIFAPRPPRVMKNTIKEAYSANIQHLVQEDGISDAEYKAGLKTIHTKYVAETILNQQNNKVLNSPPPTIHISEKSLPRKTRVILSQLRSNYSTYLNSYMSRIDEKIINECPDCKESPHDTQHLFNCTEKPTILTTYSLWTKPREAALHLGLEVEEEEVT